MTDVQSTDPVAALEVSSAPLLATDEESCRTTLDILQDPKIAKGLSEEAAGTLVESICQLLKDDCKQSESGVGVTAQPLVVLCLQILSRLCRGDVMVKSTSVFPNIVVCADKGACEVVTQVLSQHAMHPDIAELCGLLTMILSSDNVANQLAFAKVGMCEHLVSAISHNIDHANNMDILLRASRNLASNTAVGAQLISAGLSEQLAAVATKYLDNDVVIEATLWVIVNTSCDADSATILGALGVCEIVTDILARWANHTAIVQGACWAVRNLSCVEAANYAIIAKTNVIPLVVAALNTYKENAKVSECALWALANIGYDQELSVRILDAGVISALRDAAHIILTRERDMTPEMFSWIAMDEAFLWAVRNISAASEGNNVLFNEAVIQQCVVILLREHGKDAKFAEVSIGAIGNLIHNNEAASVGMAQFFMVEAVAQVTCGYFTDEIVLGTGLKALYFMCKVHHARMKEIGLDKVGAASIKAYPNNDDIVRYGCEILLNTYYVDESSRAALLAAKAIDASGRVVKIDSEEDRNEAWIPEAQVKANEWFTTSGGDDDEDEKPCGEDSSAIVDAVGDSIPATEEIAN